MQKSVGLWALVGFAVTSLGGTVLHFLYDWLNGAAWVAPFSGVNESTWEHMKLLFWPMALFSLIQGIALRHRRDFPCAALGGIVTGLVLIPVLFYTYNGAVGASPDWVNIAIFFVAAAAAYFTEARSLSRAASVRGCPLLCVAVTVTLAILFILFTFAPPEAGLFRDPVTGGYGLPA